MAKIHEIDGLQFHEIVSSQQIGQAVKKVADQITADYQSTNKVVILTVLEGGRNFSDALLDELADAKFEHVEVKASSYNGTTKSTGIVRFEGLMQLNLLGCDVLIVDDIYDTGATLANLIFKITSFCPRSVKVAVMFDKKRSHDRKVKINYIGMEVPDVFLVGFGLDYQEKYRDLPFLAQLILE
ncbi:MAG: hypothetical protein JW745_06375 [Sedimentisphaerales bacterium]|nr:hypothetical protein [Sedimentisphaerales bacterium]